MWIDPSLLITRFIYNQPRFQMTSSTELDLHTINTLQTMTKDLIRAKVQELEQQAFDADGQGYFDFAKQLKHAARELDFISYEVSSLHTELFLEELNRRTNSSMPIVSNQQDVKLPDLSQPEVINTTAVAV